MEPLWCYYIFGKCPANQLMRTRLQLSFASFCQLWVDDIFQTDKISAILEKNVVILYPFDSFIVPIKKKKSDTFLKLQAV